MLSLIKESTASIEICGEILDLLDNIYLSLSKYELIKTIEVANTGIEKCELLKVSCVEMQNEPMANASFVMRELFSLYKNYAIYWNLLKEKKYKESWGKLQDTIDDLICVAKWTEKRSEFLLDDISTHFKELEKLYPYRVFASSEMVIKKNTCSICKKDILDIDCTHIAGNLYWGEMAYNIVEDIEFTAVALVAHPLDKRCVMEIQGDNRTDMEKFKLLDYFASQITDPLLLFKVTEHKKMYKIEPKQLLRRNDKCNCGSGKKYKLCCGRNRFEEGVHCVICPIRKLSLKL